MSREGAGLAHSKGQCPGRRDLEAQGHWVTASLNTELNTTFML